MLRTGDEENFVHNLNDDNVTRRFRYESQETPDLDNETKWNNNMIDNRHNWEGNTFKGITKMEENM